MGGVLAFEPIDVGSLADWAAALGTWAGALCTFASVAVIGGGLWWEIHRRRVDDERARLAQRDAEANQARLVSSYTTLNYDTQRVVLVVRNDSDHPVRDVTLLAVHRTTREIIGQLHATKNSGWDIENERRVPVADVLRLIPGRASRRATMERAGVDITNAIFDLHVTDVAGLRWGREDGQQPRRLLG